MFFNILETRTEYTDDRHKSYSGYKTGIQYKVLDASLAFIPEKELAQFCRALKTYDFVEIVVRKEQEIHMSPLLKALVSQEKVQLVWIY